MYDRGLDRTSADLYLKKLIVLCKKTKDCPYCGFVNGTVKKHPGALKILHEREDFYANIDQAFHPAGSGSNYSQELNPLVV
jgi:hypothetical protein